MDRVRVGAQLAQAACFLCILPSAACGGGPSSACPGRACPSASVDLASPEGGEIRLERVMLADGTVISRGIAFFKSSQMPDTIPFPDVEPAALGKCQHLLTSATWPIAQATMRKYVDVGTLTLKAPDGTRYLWTKLEHVTDFLGRTHDLAYTFQYMNKDHALESDVNYDVIIGGSSDYPAAVWSGAIAVPPAFKPKDPDLVAMVTVKKGDPLAITWETPPPIVIKAPLHSRIEFLDDQSGPSAKGLTHLCLASDDTGSFTVGGDVTNELPMRGTLTRGVVTHQVRELEAGRRVDLIGALSFPTLFVVTL